ncbi:MAG: outer membrane beta-barrel family protein [Ferruginibacter sp.]
MKILHLFFTLFLFGTSMPAFAQVSGNITGHNNKPAAGAVVSLLKTVDSSLIKTTIAAADGNFEIGRMNAGHFILMISSVGSKKYYSVAFEIDSVNKSKHFAQIILQKETAILDAVTVTTKKPMIERKADRTIVNVDAFISNAGSNALEVLEKSPGVEVDNNETISLKGKPGVLIYIDDKPTYLSGAELAAYLKSLPAASLDKIEIMTTAPAKYDAAGNAGIINIRTKKSKLKGFSGNAGISYRQAKYSDVRNTFSFNYRNNKLNLFSNNSYSGGRSFNNLDISRRYNNNDGSLRSAFSQNSYIKRWYNSLNLKLGMDYNLSKKTTVGIVLSRLARPSTQQTKNTGIFSHLQNSIDSVITADNREDAQFRNSGINLNFLYTADSIGNTLSMDLDYLRYTTGNDQLFKNASFNGMNVLKTQDELTGALPSYLNIYSFKTDYVHPLNKKSKLETGIKASYISTNNIGSYFTVLNNIPTADYEKTNHFMYDENINAAYANFSTEWKRFSLQFGLRAENTISKGHQLGNPIKPDSSFKKNYTNLFPTVFASYKLDSAGNNQLNLAYSKRIDRPYYEDLNPFISPLDKFTYYAGNPFLNPQFTQHIELSHTYKNIITTTVSYDRVKDEMDETIELNGNTFISRTGNIGRKDVFGYSIDATIKPAKWWTLLAYFQYIYQHTQSKVYTESLNTKGGWYSANLVNQFALTKGWSAELTLRGRTAILDGQFNSGRTGVINMAAQKKMLKDKGTLKIALQDIFNTRINEGYINGLKDGSGYYHNLNDSRALVLAFTYRFSKGAKNAASRKTGGADDEQNRVKN